jgi:hypothetical protein
MALPKQNTVPITAYDRIADFAINSSSIFSRN